jgi:hypothetical protein
MIRRLWSNIKKDWLHGVRHFYLVITIASAAIFILFIRFVLPVDYASPDVYQYVEPSFGATDLDGAIPFGSKSEFLTALNENPNAYGIAVEGTRLDPVVTIYMQSSVDESFAELIKQSLLLEFSGQTIEPLRTEVLIPELASVAFRDRFIPLILVMDSALIGMFLLSVMLFVEKEQKMHTAYMVSPGRLFEHLMSKAVVMMALSLISATLVVGFLRGLEANYAYLYMVMIPSSFVGAVIGLLIGAIYRNVSHSMTGLVTVYLILAIPIISYIAPSFAPSFNVFIPTHHMILGVEAAVLPYLGFAVVWQSALVLLGFGVVGFGVSYVMYKRALYYHA